MTNFKSKVLNYLNDRGLIYQIIDPENLDKKLVNDKISLYAGFDLTAPSLHVGSLISIMVLRAFQKFGYRPIILLGGATTKIGDPSGKDKTRSVLTPEEIAKNKESIKKIFSKFLDIDKALILDNDEWFSELKYIDFLRDIGRHFSVNQMLGYESVKQRLDREQNLSFLEFNYMILQAYDFVELKKNYNCFLEIGGSDQWGNIVNGVELNRKIDLKAGEIYGFTTPLLVNSDGKKMGKTESGAMWLDEEMLSSYDYYQFFRNVTDDKVIELLKYFTDLDIKEIEKLAKLEGKELNQAKEILAFEATKICHGEEAANKAKETAIQTFQNNQLGGDLPQISLSEDELKQGIPFSLLIAKTEIVASRGEAKRIILGGGGKINDEAIKDPNQLITQTHFSGENQIKVSAGKKKHAIVKIG